uniref:Uncharacterized protein n=1 Tax=Daphnia magna TaxID=35525 RepID=A0A0P5Z326_9CRUS
MIINLSSELPDMPFFKIPLWLCKSDTNLQHSCARYEYDLSPMALWMGLCLGRWCENVNLLADRPTIKELFGILKPEVNRKLKFR